MSDRVSGSARYFEAVALEFDITKPLRWSYILVGVVPVEQVDLLVDQLTKLGFPDADAGIDKLQTDDLFLVCSEECVHVTDSFCQRVMQVNNWAEQHGLKLVDFDAGLVDR